MKLTAKDFWVLICDDSKYAIKGKKVNRMVCGVFASKKEAQEVFDTVKECLCKHYIKRCMVTVKY